MIANTQQILIHNGDHLGLLDTFYPGPDPFIQLWLWSTPYPGQRGFDVDADHYLGDWLPQRLQLFAPLMLETAVYVQVVKFKRRPATAGFKKTRFDKRVFRVADVIENSGFHLLDVHPWDKINSPPSGAHDDHDRDAYELIFVAVKSDRYQRQPYLQPYAAKTVAKSQTGNFRQKDIFGGLGGGHNNLNPDGAAADNIIRISPSGDQNRPRAAGGSFPRELAQRFVFQYTQPGQWVFDPCMGVATTGVEAIGGLCNFIGVEQKKADYGKAKRWLYKNVKEANEAGDQDYTLTEIKARSI